MLVSIEGNIGSGKSTVIEYLKSLNDNQFVFVDEPVSEWLEIKDKNGMNALDCFYSDQKRNSFCFQVLAYITRLKKLMDVIKNNKDNKIIITERSIETDRNVFAKMLYNDDLLSSIEWVTYNYWFDTFKELSSVSKIIYIKATPEKCLERIAKRNRVEEEGIKLEYLSKCHNYHTEWLHNNNIVITINGHDTVNNIRNKVIEIINTIC
jgi:deoxyadenosine/deoxycytidine kinase